MKMHQGSGFCDYFVVMSAPSSVRVKTIADHIEESLEDQGWRAKHKEGYQDGVWILLDYGDVITHVFHKATRQFYDLENLWGDLPKQSYFHDIKP